MNSIEICTAAGRQALRLEQAGFDHRVLAEYECEYGDCLRENRLQWNVICGGVHDFDAKPYHNKIDLLSGGFSYLPFSVAGK